MKLSKNVSQHAILNQLKELQELQQTKTKEYMSTQQKLTDQLQNTQLFITIEQLKFALKSNNWSSSIGQFLNPLAFKNNVIMPQQKETLLKHSEQKLILLQRIIQEEEQITQFKEQIIMINNDIQGIVEQMNTLILEYEELEEVVSYQQNKELKQVLELNFQLRDLKSNYTSLAEKKLIFENENNTLQEQIADQCQKLKLIKLNIQIKALQYNQFNVEQCYNLILKSAQNKGEIELLCNLALLINEKIKQCLLNKGNQQQIIKEIELLQENSINKHTSQNNIKLFDKTIFQEILDLDQIEEFSIFFHQELPKRIQRYLLNIEIQQLKQKLIENEKLTHQIIYEQSMIQCQYNRLEQLLPNLQSNKKAQQFQHILNRMNHIETLKQQKKLLCQNTYPKQIKSIQEKLIISEKQLLSYVNELSYCTKIEQEYYYKIFPNSNKLPQLTLEPKNIDTLKLEQLLEDNRKKYFEQQELYNQTINNLKERLKYIEQSNNFKENTINNREYIKENLSPESKDTSILGTVQIDISQERTTHKYSVMRSRKQMFMNEPTDRSCSSYSFLGHRTSDPLCQKTKLTLKQQTNMSSYAKNPLLSPTSNHHISIEQSLSLHSSARRFPEQERSPVQLTDCIFKVLKRTIRASNFSTLSSKFVRYNGKMKCLEFYNSNKMPHDLGLRESALCIRQIKEVRKRKQNIVELVLSKYQTIELTFSKETLMNEFIKLI